MGNISPLLKLEVAMQVQQFKSRSQSSSHFVLSAALKVHKLQFILIPVAFKPNNIGEVA